MRGCYALIGMNDVVSGLSKRMTTKKTAATGGKKKASASPKKAEKVTSAARVRATTSKKKSSKSALVKKLLDAAEKKVTAEDVKASIGDVIRLLQLQKELEEEEPREITIQWIDREERGHVHDK